MYSDRTSVSMVQTVAMIHLSISTANPTNTDGQATSTMIL